MNNQISNVKDTVTNSKDEVSGALWAEFEKVKDGFAELQKDFTKYGAVAKDKAGEAVDSVRRNAKNARNWSADRLDEVEDKVSEHPVTSIAIAVGIGYVLSVLMSKK